MAEHELEEYEEEIEDQPAGDATETAKGFVGVHTVSFDDMQLKRELLRAIGDCGFEHPSEIQQQCIPVALQGQDVIGQAKAGVGKTAVFVLAVLHQLEPEDGKVSALVIAHTRELSQQIEAEFKRFSKYCEPEVRVANYVGGIARKLNQDELKDKTKCPHIVIGTPGRLKDLVESNTLPTADLRFFIVDECDKIFEQMDMRSVVQKIYIKCPKKMQVMMFSATISDEVRAVTRKFMKNVRLPTIGTSLRAPVTCGGAARRAMRTPPQASLIL